MNFNSFQRLVARILLVSLCLQSCGGPFNSLIPVEEGQTAHLHTNAQQIIPPTYIQPLVDQILTAQGGHAVTFYEYKGQIQASVASLDDKKEVYNGVPVEVKEATDLKDLPHLPKKIQAGRIHIQKTSTGKPARVVIYKGGGLAGGGKNEDEDEEREPTYEEKFGNIKRKQAQIQQPNEKEKRYKPSNNQQEKESSYAYKRPRSSSSQPVPAPNSINKNKTILTKRKGPVTFTNADKKLNEASKKRARTDSSLLIQVKEELQEEDEVRTWQASMTLEGMGRSSLEEEGIGNQTKLVDQGKENYESGKKCEELYDGTNIVELKDKHLKEAIKHYKKAIKQGYEQAQERLIDLRDKGRYSRLDAITMRGYEQAIKGAGIEFKEFIEKAKATEGGMKLSDLIVMQLDSEKVPPKILWGGIPQEACYNPSYIFKPLFKLPNTKKYEGGAVMAIDPSGKGKCETAYCVGKRCGGYYFITALGGMAGGYDEDTNGLRPEVRQKLLSIAQKNKVHYLFVEPNQGLDQLLLEDAKSAGIEELEPLPIDNNTPRGEKGKGKANRILNTLQGLLKTHRLIIDRQVLENDFKETTKKKLNYRFFYQLLTIGLPSSSSGSLKPSTYTDRLDAVAMAIGQLKKLSGEQVSEKSGIDVQELHSDLDGADNLSLHDAAKNGDMELVKYLIGQGARVNTKNRAGDTVLVCAVSNSNIELVKYLISQGAEVNDRDAVGGTVLLLAAENGHRAVVNLLLNKGADVNAEDRFGYPVLLLAAENGHRAVVNLLLNKGADVNAEDRFGGETALLQAAKNGHRDTVNLLLEKGADVNAKDLMGKTALLRAASNGHREVAELLLEKMAGPKPGDQAQSKGWNNIIAQYLNATKDNNGATALLRAAKNGHLDTVKWLLRKKADVNITDKYGHTALLYAAEKGHRAVVNLLLGKKANANVTDEYGHTALLWAALKGHRAVVESLLNKGADVNAKNRFGHTALLYAARNGHLAMVDLLLDKGADINAKDKDGYTMLMCAVSSSNIELVDYLVKQGADIDAKDSRGKTALLWAAKNGHRAVVDLLLNKGADIDAKDSRGKTALLCAVSSNNMKLVKYLVKQGADTEAENNKGKKAIDLARRNGHQPILDILSRRPQV